MWPISQTAGLLTIRLWFRFSTSAIISELHWLSLSAYYAHKAVALTLRSCFYYHWIIFLYIAGDIMANNQNEALNETLNGINLLKIEILLKILIFFSEYAPLFWKIQRPRSEQNSQWAIFVFKKKEDYVLKFEWDSKRDVERD